MNSIVQGVSKKYDRTTGAGTAWYIRLIMLYHGTRTHTFCIKGNAYNLKQLQVEQVRPY